MIEVNREFARERVGDRSQDIPGLNSISCRSSLVLSGEVETWRQGVGTTAPPVTRPNKVPAVREPRSCSSNRPISGRPVPLSVRRR
jgi:hypothetical protein